MTGGRTSKVLVAWLLIASSAFVGAAPAVGATALDDTTDDLTGDDDTADGVVENEIGPAHERIAFHDGPKGEAGCTGDTTATVLEIRCVQVNVTLQTAYAETRVGHAVGVDPVDLPSDPLDAVSIEYLVDDETDEEWPDVDALLDDEGCPDEAATPSTDNAERIECIRITVLGEGHTQAIPRAPMTLSYWQEQGLSHAPVGHGIVPLERFGYDAIVAPSAEGDTDPSGPSASVRVPECREPEITDPAASAEEIRCLRVEVPAGAAPGPQDLLDVPLEGPTTEVPYVRATVAVSEQPLDRSAYPADACSGDARPIVAGEIPDALENLEADPGSLSTARCVEIAVTASYRGETVEESVALPVPAAEPPAVTYYAERTDPDPPALAGCKEGTETADPQQASCVRVDLGLHVFEEDLLVPAMPVDIPVPQLGPAPQVEYALWTSTSEPDWDAAEQPLPERCPDEHRRDLTAGTAADLQGARCLEVHVAVQDGSGAVDDLASEVRFAVPLVGADVSGLPDPPDPGDIDPDDLDPSDAALTVELREGPFVYDGTGECRGDTISTVQLPGADHAVAGEDVTAAECATVEVAAPTVGLENPLSGPYHVPLGCVRGPDTAGNSDCDAYGYTDEIEASAFLYDVASGMPPAAQVRSALMVVDATQAPFPIAESVEVTNAVSQGDEQVVGDPVEIQAKLHADDACDIPAGEEGAVDVPPSGDPTCPGDKLAIQRWRVRVDGRTVKTIDIAEPAEDGIYTTTWTPGEAYQGQRQEIEIAVDAYDGHAWGAAGDRVADTSLILDLEPPSLSEASVDPLTIAPAVEAGPDGTTLTVGTQDGSSPTWTVDLADADGEEVRSWTPADDGNLTAAANVTVDWNGSWPNGSAVPDGVYTFVAEAEDAVGNANRTNASVAVNSHAPRLVDGSDLGLPAFVASGDQVAFTASFTEPVAPGSATATIVTGHADPTFQGQVSGAEASFDFTMPDTQAKDGLYDLRIQASDDLSIGQSKQGTSIREIRIDNHDPTVEAEDRYAFDPADGTGTFHVGVSEAVELCATMEQGGAKIADLGCQDLARGQGKVTWNTDRDDGTYTLVLEAEDAAGKTTTAEAEVVVDREAPDVSFERSGDVVHIRFDDATFQEATVDVEGRSERTVQADATVDTQGLSLPASIRVHATDLAGHATEASYTIQSTRSGSSSQTSGDATLELVMPAEDGNAHLAGRVVAEVQPSSAAIAGATCRLADGTSVGCSVQGDRVVVPAGEWSGTIDLTVSVDTESGQHLASTWSFEAGLGSVVDDVQVEASGHEASIRVEAEAGLDLVGTISGGEEERTVSFERRDGAYVATAGNLSRGDHTLTLAVKTSGGPVDLPDETTFEVSGERSGADFPLPGFEAAALVVGLAAAVLLVKRRSSS